MTTFRRLTRFWGNMERVQVLRDETEEVELENGENDENEERRP